MTDSRALLHYLQRAGPRRGGALARELGLSSAALSRLHHRQRDRLLRVGRARATTYALRRSLEGLPSTLPVYEVAPDGALRLALTLHPVEPLGFYVEGHVPEVHSGFYQTDPSEPGPDPGVDLPWFLLDLKPVGFLGRAWLRAHSGLGFPTELSWWSGEEVLRFAAHFAEDLPGAFLVGEAARVRWEHSAGRPRVFTEEHFPELMVRAREGRGGSSAGGEQPKFTVTTREDEEVVQHIVKFSPPMDTPGGRRWADLLVAEHLTLQLLSERGLPAARSRLLDVEGRRCLMVRRFDRHGTAGRSGLCSLSSLDSSGVSSELRRWSLVTRQLVDQGRLSPQDHEQVEWLECFGHAIANTDMHPGNLSVRLRGTTLTGLAPTYDMLPMFHAPGHGGELPTGLYSLRSELDPLPASAVEAARELWARVADHAQVSVGFRKIARDQRALL